MGAVCHGTIGQVESISVKDARRLALARAGLLKPGWTQLPKDARGAGSSANNAALKIIERFGYLQLDTVSIAGARSHALVLLSRLKNVAPSLGEQLLTPGAPLFEYWGHEASWLPMDLYPHFEFRRQAFKTHPWWGDVISSNKSVSKRLLKRIRDDGAIRSIDMEGKGSSGWWDFKIAKRVATALWSSGELAISQRKNFIRSYDLSERVVPAKVRATRVDKDEALRALLMRALDGHGWATRGTLAATWRLRNMKAAIDTALEELADDGQIVRCQLATPKPRTGWIRPRDFELAARLRRVRLADDVAVLLSPFDPVLWDRQRVRELFGFEQVLEIFKPAPKRVFGYYCLPVLSGGRLIGRVDLKADRKLETLTVLSRHFEQATAKTAGRAAMKCALTRLAAQLDLRLCSRR